MAFWLECCLVAYFISFIYIERNNVKQSSQILHIAFFGRAQQRGQNEIITILIARIEMFNFQLNEFENV